MSKSVGQGGQGGGVVDEGGGGGEDSGPAGEDGGLGLTPLPLTGLGGLHSSQVSSLGGGDLRSVLHGLGGDSVKHGGNQGLGVEGGGDKRLRVEGGGNSVIDWSNGESGVSHTEAEPISNILYSLKLTIGINVGVSSRHASVSVADLLLDRVEVGVAVVQVAKFVLGVELTASGVGSIGSIASIGVGNLALGSRHQGRECDLTMARLRVRAGRGETTYKDPHCWLFCCVMLNGIWSSGLRLAVFILEISHLQPGHCSNTGEISHQTFQTDI